MRRTIAGLLMGLTFGIGTFAVTEVAVPKPAHAANIRPIFDRIVVKAQDDGAAAPRTLATTDEDAGYARPGVKGRQIWGY